MTAYFCCHNIIKHRLIYHSDDVKIKYQFIRREYFTVDRKYTSENHLVFNRIVALKDSRKNKK